MLEPHLLGFYRMAKSDVFDASYLVCVVFSPILNPIDFFCIASNKNCVPKINKRSHWFDSYGHEGSTDGEKMLMLMPTN